MRSRHPGGAGWRLLAVAVGLLLTPRVLQGQQATVRGTVRAEGSLEPIPFASVQIAALGRGVLADDRGYFVLSGLPPGSASVRVAALGFEPELRELLLPAGVTETLEIILAAAPVTLPGIEVQVGSEEGITAGAAGPGAIRLDPSVIDVVPGLAEADVLRTLQTLPSVQAVSDFSSALYVRGGSPDQNLMLLDGAPLFNPFHLGGLFGSVDPDAVAAVNVLPGAFPARVGDRVSSVIEMRTRDGGRDRVRGNGSVGVVSSRLSVDGPLPGAEGSYLFSFRRTYLDLFTDAAYRLGLIEATLPYSFDDSNLKLTHDVGDLGRLSLALHYDGETVDLPSSIDYDGDVDFDFGTRSASLAYWQPIGDLVAEVRTAISSFDGRFDAYEDELVPSTPGSDIFEVRREEVVSAGTTIRNALFALDLSWYAGDHLIRGGVQGDRYRFDYDVHSSPDALGGYVPNFILEETPTTLAAYLEDQWSPADRLELRMGTRVLSAGERGTAWMPRLGLQFDVTPRLTLSVGGGRSAQAIHSLRDEESLAASLVAYDLLAGVPEAIGLTRAEDAVIGATWNGAATSIRLDAYAKRFTGLPIAPTPEEVLEAPVIVTEGFVAGEGSARGFEGMVRHARGRGEVTLSYAYLRASRSLRGSDYAPRFERRHTVDLLGVMPVRRSGQASVRFVYGSGQPYTPAVGVATPLLYDPDRGVLTPGPYGAGGVVLLGEHNSARLPHYLRLDAGLRGNLNPVWFGREMTVTPYLQVLNLLNTRNVLFGEPTAFGFGQPMLEYAPQLPIFPTIGVEWRF